MSLAAPRTALPRRPHTPPSSPSAAPDESAEIVGSNVPQGTRQVGNLSYRIFRRAWQMTIPATATPDNAGRSRARENQRPLTVDRQQFARAADPGRDGPPTSTGPVHTGLVPFGARQESGVRSIAHVAFPAPGPQAGTKFAPRADTTAKCGTMPRARTPILTAIAFSLVGGTDGIIFFSESSPTCLTF